jgi:hypothetical protein
MSEGLEGRAQRDLIDQLYYAVLALAAYLPLCMGIFAVNRIFVDPLKPMVLPALSPSEVIWLSVCSGIAICAIAAAAGREVIVVLHKHQEAGFLIMKKALAARAAAMSLAVLGPVCSLALLLDKSLAVSPAVSTALSIGFVCHAATLRVMSAGFLVSICALVFMTNFHDPLLLMNVISLVLVVGLIRFAVVLITDNWGDLASLDRKLLWKSTGRALVYWLLFIVPIGIGILLHQVIKDYVYDAVYIDYPQTFTSPVAKRVLVDSPRENPRADLKEAWTWEIEQWRSDVKIAIGVVEAKKITTEREARREFDQQVNAAIPKSIATKPECKNLRWFSFSCHAKRRAADAANNAWSEARRSMVDAANAKFNAVLVTVGGKVDQALQVTKAEIDEDFDAQWSARMQAIDLFFDGLAFADTLSLIILIFGVLKSYSVILARILYAEQAGKAGRHEDPRARLAEGYVPSSMADEHPSAFFSLRSEEPLLGPGGRPLPAPQMVQTANRFPLRIATNREYFASVWQDRLGGKPKPRIPSFRQAPVARLLNGRYVMTHISLTENDNNSVIFNADARYRFVAVTLAEDQELILDLSCIVAFTEGMRFSTVYSLKLSTMLFGKTLFHCIRGHGRGADTGRLILKVCGQPATRAAADTYKTFDPHSLVAWERSTQFNVVSHLTWWDIYGSGIRLARHRDPNAPKRQGQGVILQVVEPRWWQFGGAARFIGCFLMPF